MKEEIKQEIKEEAVDINNMNLMASASDTSGMSLTNNQGSLHLGPIITPGSNETISIVIPLSAQLASLSKGIPQIHIPQYVSKQDLIINSSIDNKALTDNKRINKAAPVRIMEDKTKGCPYENCCRYGRAFSRAHDLKRHIARHKARENKETQPPDRQTVYACPMCDEKFYSAHILERHRQSHHGQNNDLLSSMVELYTCHFCKKNFQTESLLSAHLPIHLKMESDILGNPPIITRFNPEHGPPPLIQTATSLATASASTSSATSDDDFRLEDMLLLRKAPISNIRPIQVSPSSGGKIRCEYCSKTFKTKWTLSSHVAAHEGRFQYQCCTCSKKFVRKSHYESHVRSHDAARPYVCEHCGKTFKESKHRREHLKRKHPSNKNAIQSLLDSISACVNEEPTAATTDQSKFTILTMPMNLPS